MANAAQDANLTVLHGDLAVPDSDSSMGEESMLTADMEAYSEIWTAVHRCNKTKKEISGIIRKHMGYDNVFPPQTCQSKATKSTVLIPCKKIFDRVPCSKCNRTCNFQVYKDIQAHVLTKYSDFEMPQLDNPLSHGGHGTQSGYTR